MIQHSVLKIRTLRQLTLAIKVNILLKLIQQVKIYWGTLSELAYIDLIIIMPFPICTIAMHNPHQGVGSSQWLPVKRTDFTLKLHFPLYLAREYKEHSLKQQPQ